jgi:hypothetical protein
MAVDVAEVSHPKPWDPGVVEFNLNVTVQYNLAGVGRKTAMANIVKRGCSVVPIKILGLCIVLVLCLSGTLAAEGKWCRFQDRTLGLDSSVPISLDRLILTIGGESSGGRIFLRNLGSESIRYHLIIIEFTNEAGRHQLSVPVYNTDIEAGGNTPLEFHFIDWLYAHNSYSGQRLTPGSSESLEFTSPVILAECPTNVLVSIVELEYSDGRRFVWASSNVNLNSAISAVPLPSLTNLQRWNSIVVSASLYLDSEGNPEVRDIRTSKPGASEWLAHFVSHWKFAPFIVKGAASNGCIRIVLSVGNLSVGERRINSELKAHPHEPLFYLRIVPPSNRPPGLEDRWLVLIGRDPVSRGRG